MVIIVAKPVDVLVKEGWSVMTVGTPFVIDVVTILSTPEVITVVSTTSVVRLPAS